jgi:6-phosphogluconate dehydrogenase
MGDSCRIARARSQLLDKEIYNILNKWKNEELKSYCQSKQK